MAVKKRKFVRKNKPKAVKRTAKGRSIQNAAVKRPAAKASPASDHTREIARKIAGIASDHKAEDIVVMDLRPVTSFTDYFVVASGMSDRQVQAIADSVRDEMKRAGRLPISEEGFRDGHWALIDYGDVILHVFYHEDREHYQLESLWHDAPRVKFKGIN